MIWNKALQQKSNNSKSSRLSALCCLFLSHYLINPCQYWGMCVQTIVSASQYIGQALLYLVKIQNAYRYLFYFISSYLCSLCSYTVTLTKPYPWILFWYTHLQKRTHAKWVKGESTLRALIMEQISDSCEDIDHDATGHSAQGGKTVMWLSRWVIPVKPAATSLKMHCMGTVTFH